MRKKKLPAVPYEIDLYDYLKNPKDAVLYLNACLDLAIEDKNPDLFLLALYHVARAKGFKKVANKARVHRVSLSRMLSKKGNPEWKSLFKVMMASRLRFRVERLPANSSLNA